MAASPAIPLLLLLAVLAATADAIDQLPVPPQAEAVCNKTTDPVKCKNVLKQIPANIADKLSTLPAGASAVADQCILTAYWWAAEYKSKAIDAIGINAPKSGPAKCAEDCVKAFEGIIDILDPTGDGAGGDLKVPEEERLLAVHVGLADLLRRPPLCKTCCDGEAGKQCNDKMSELVKWYFARMWALLDFTNAVLDDVYPAAKTAAKTTAKSSGNTVKTMKKEPPATPAATPEVVVTQAPPVTTFD